MRLISLAILLLMFPIYGSAATLSYGYSPQLVSMDAPPPIATSVADVGISALSEPEVALSRVEIATTFRHRNPDIESSPRDLAATFWIEDPGRDIHPTI